MRNVTHIRRFREEDVRSISKRLDILTIESEISDLIVSMSSGYTYTILLNETPAAIIGANIMWKGVAQVWAIVSDVIRGKGIQFTKMVDALLSRGAEFYNIRRYHCVVHGADRENIKWLYLLGFEYEFCMYKAAPDGADALGFVRWENGHVRRTRQGSGRLQQSMDELLPMA